MTFRLAHFYGAALLTLLAGPAVAFDQPSAVPRMSGATGDVLRAALMPCWNTSLASDAVVTIFVTMNRDGTVESAELVDIGDDAGPDHQAAAQSALRAVLNPSCQPWPLPAREWPAWQYIQINFDPRNAF